MYSMVGNAPSLEFLGPPSKGTLRRDNSIRFSLALPDFVALSRFEAFQHACTPKRKKRTPESFLGFVRIEDRGCDPCSPSGLARR